MNSKSQGLKDKVTADFEVGKKVFHGALSKAQVEIDAVTAEITKLRADLKTQTAEAKVKTMDRVNELTKKLDAARKEEQGKIDARLKELHKVTESVNAEVKHATAEGKAAAETKAKAVRQEYDSARGALAASLDAELAEWKARISDALAAAVEKKAAAKASVEAKIADLHVKHEAAQKKLDALKQADASAFGELHRGVRTAIAEVNTAAQRARAEIAAAL